MQGRERRRTKWFAFRLREAERDGLRAAARKVGVWESELAREAIGERVNDILVGSRDSGVPVERGGQR